MKTISIIMSLLICSSLVMAQELVTEEDIVIAGTTPDSPYYKIELAFEGFTEMFGENIRIAHAKERLAETKVMIAEGKIIQSKIAIQNFERVRLKLKNQTRIQEHKKLIDNLGQKISNIASNRNLTDGEKFQIKTLIQNQKENIEQEKIQNIIQTQNVNQEQAEQLLIQEKNMIQNRVTTQIENKVNNYNK